MKVETIADTVQSRIAAAIHHELLHPQPVWRVTCVGNPFVVNLVTGALEPQHCPNCGGAIIATVIEPLTSEGAEQ